MAASIGGGAGRRSFRSVGKQEFQGRLIHGNVYTSCFTVPGGQKTEQVKRGAKTWQLLT